MTRADGRLGALRVRACESSTSVIVICRDEMEDRRHASRAIAIPLFARGRTVFGKAQFRVWANKDKDGVWTSWGRVIGCDAAVMTRPIGWWAHQRVGTGPHACRTVNGSSTSMCLTRTSCHSAPLQGAVAFRMASGLAWHTRNRSFRNTIAIARERVVRCCCCSLLHGGDSTG